MSIENYTENGNALHVDVKKGAKLATLPILFEHGILIAHWHENHEVLS